MNIKNCAIIIFIVLLLSIAVVSFGEEDFKCHIIFFYSPNCQKCQVIKAEFIPGIEQKYKDKIEIEYRDIDDVENYKLLLGYEEEYNKTKKDLPIVFIDGKFLSGESGVKNNLARYIEYSLLKGPPQPKEIPVGVDLIRKFKSFKPLAIVLAGLIDGINPCAFTVIVFFVTFLVFQRYRKREIIATGASFIFAVFLAYLLLGLGLFNLLYRLKLFPYVVKIIYAVTASLCFILGALAMYDIVRFKRTHESQDMILRLPDKIKYHIQRIIGLHYRQRQKGELPRKNILGLVLSAVIVGFLISVLEAVCTGQVYLPTIAFVFKTTDLKLQAFAYLVLYNLMFIVPLFLVFIFALLGVTSAQFSYFMQRHIIVVKMLMAGLFFGLGAILILGL